MELTTVWFILIAVLWIGYFSLEGFDFGVGMLLPVLARDDTERRVMINTIGPVWDGNEVWVLVAGGATFAAFPEWYATLFSGFYLPLLLILRRPDRARPRLRVPPQARRGRAGGAAGTSRSSSARSCPRSCGASRSPTSCAGVPIDADKEFTGNLLHPAQPVRPARRAGHAAALPHPRRDVRRAQDRRRHPAPGPRAGGAGRRWSAAVLAVVFLVVDAGDDRHRRLGGASSWSPRSRWSAASSRRARPGGLGLPRHLRHDRPRRGRAVRRPVPRRDAVDDRSRRTR